MWRGGKSGPESIYTRSCICRMFSQAVNYVLPTRSGERRWEESLRNVQELWATPGIRSRERGIACGRDAPAVLFLPHHHHPEAELCASSYVIRLSCTEYEVWTKYQRTLSSHSIHFAEMNRILENVVLDEGTTSFVRSLLGLARFYYRQHGQL